MHIWQVLHEIIQGFQGVISSFKRKFDLVKENTSQ